MASPPSSAGVSRALSSSAAPVKSSMYTWMYRGARCSAPSASRPSFSSRSRLADQRRVAGGGGCASSKRACASAIAPATSVETLSNLFGTYAPPNPSRLSTTTPASPSGPNHTKHCIHASAH
eukprot:1570223-Pleurochrysis_carterae.AAC.2